MDIDKDKEAVQQEKMIAMASQATELVLVGMAENGDELFNAESEGVDPTFWDVYIKFNEVGDEWDIEETSFKLEAEAIEFANRLTKLVPDGVCLEVL